MNDHEIYCVNSSIACFTLRLNKNPVKNKSPAQTDHINLGVFALKHMVFLLESGICHYQYLIIIKHSRIFGKRYLFSNRLYYIYWRNATLELTLLSCTPKQNDISSFAIHDPARSFRPATIRTKMIHYSPKTSKLSVAGMCWVFLIYLVLW